MATTYTFSQKGLRIMQAGLSFQVASLLIFMLLAVIFALRCRRQPDKLDERFDELRASGRFRFFLWCKFMLIGGRPSPLPPKPHNGLEANGL
jgi:hypothetical protein